MLLIETALTLLAIVIAFVYPSLDAVNSRGLRPCSRGWRNDARSR